MFEKGADRHLFPIIYFISHSVLLYKFILEGDDVNLDREPDEKGQERKEWITRVVHDVTDRLLDGRWKGTIVQEKRPVKKIRWKRLMIRIVISSMLQDNLSQNHIVSNTLKESCHKSD